MTNAILALGGILVLALVGFVAFVAWHWISAGRAARRNERLQKNDE